MLTSIIIINKKIVIDKVFILILAFLTIHTIINIFFENTTFILFFKQILGISISYLTYKNLFNNVRTEKLIKIYLHVAFIVSVIGIIQQIAYILKFEMLCDLSWLIKGQRIAVTNLGLIRVTSIMVEPAHLAMVLTPSVYIAISSLYSHNFKIINKFKSIILVMCYILTFSSVAYLGLAIIFILNINSMRLNLKKILLMFLLVTSMITLYNFVDDFKLRVDDTLQALTYGNIESKNLSTYALLSNLRIAEKSLINTLGMGSGIGSHRNNYYKYINEVIDSSKVQMELNIDDANSLFIRLISELGIISIAFVFIFIYKFRVSKIDIEKNIISYAIISFLIVRLIRQGHYFNDGFLFFIVIYIKNYKEYKYIN